jgi:sulfite reductase (ferredoxin)
MMFAKGFVDACRAATEQMGKDLKLAPAGQATAARTGPTPEIKSAVLSISSPAPSGSPVYDLRGVACPMNYVKTKLKLEMMDAGERLEVWLDAGEPIKNVPLSLKNDGHKLLLQEPLEAAAAHYRILVEKVE